MNSDLYVWNIHTNKVKVRRRITERRSWDIDIYDDTSNMTDLSSELFYFHRQFLALLSVLPLGRFLAFNDLQQVQVLLFELLLLQQQFVEARINISKEKGSLVRPWRVWPYSMCRAWKCYLNEPAVQREIKHQFLRGLEKCTKYIFPGILCETKLRFFARSKRNDWERGSRKFRTFFTGLKTKYMFAYNLILLLYNLFIQFFKFYTWVFKDKITFN